MKKLLVTGSGGFIGQYLLPLVKTNDVVRFVGDLRNIEDVEKNINEDISIVINLASKVYGSSEELSDVNITGLKNLISALEKKAPNLEKFIHIGSAAEYGLSELPITEMSPTNPTGEYGKTKLMQTEMVMNAFCNTRVNIVVLRLFNVVGKNMSENMLFAKIKNNFEDNNVSEIVISNKESVRDWIDVRDVVNVIAKFVTEKTPNCQIYNLARGLAVTNNEVILAFEKYRNIQKKVIENSTLVDCSVADISKLLELFPSWESKYNLNDMVRGLYE